MRAPSNQDCAGGAGGARLLPYGTATASLDRFLRRFDGQSLWDAWRSAGASADPLDVPRARRVLLYLAGVWLLSLFDLSMTMRAEIDGVLNECNPLAAHVLALGTPAVLAFKLVPLCGASTLFVRFRHRVSTEIGIVVALIAYAAVALQWKLCYQMYEIVIVGNCTPSSFDYIDAIIRHVPTF